MRHMHITSHTEEEVMEGLTLASRDLLSRGITSIHDMGGATGEVTFRALQRAAESDQCQARVYAMLWALNEDEQFHRSLYSTGLGTGFGDDRFRLGHFKVMLDGSSSGPTAKTRQPYAVDPSYDGILHMSPEVAVERIVEAHRRGFACTAHAVGDRAIEILLDAYEEAQRRYPRPGVRHRIEHCVICPPDLRARMKALGVVPVPQPSWFQDFGDGYIQNYGEWRVEHFKPLRSWLDEGLIPALSTDCPVTWADPFLNLYAALTRKTGSGRVAPGEQQVSIEEALWMYTYGSAYAEMAEGRKGTLAQGMLADVIVLDRDLLQSSAEAVREACVDMTVVGGRVLFERG
jgi:predicted amidohydrolase YtcJ